MKLTLVAWQVGHVLGIVSREIHWLETYPRYKTSITLPTLPTLEQIIERIEFAKKYGKKIENSHLHFDEAYCEHLKGKRAMGEEAWLSADKFNKLLLEKSSNCVNSSFFNLWSTI